MTARVEGEKEAPSYHISCTTSTKAMPACLWSSRLPQGRPISIKRIAISGIVTKVLHNTLSVALSASETIAVWATACLENQGKCFL